LIPNTHKRKKKYCNEYRKNTSNAISKNTKFIKSRYYIYKKTIYNNKYIAKLNRKKTNYIIFNYV